MIPACHSFKTTEERIAKGKTHSGGTPYVLWQQKKPERHDPTMFVCSSSFPPVDRGDVAETSLADDDEEEVAAASADDIHGNDFVEFIVVN